MSTNLPTSATCCVGVQRYTPAEIDNRSGLTAILYRIGTQARFKATMQAMLSSAALPELHSLTTRSDDDFTLALIDAWAAVLDVLTFYNERMANEQYLPTATERRSAKWLAELIGYRPRPGLAAQVELAFRVDDAEGAPQVTTVKAGTQIQSIPKPDELPQVFETSDEQEVRARWNAMKPRRFYPQPLTTDMSEALLAGNYASLRPGTQMLVVDHDEQKAFKTVARVRFDGKTNQTLVQFSGPTTSPTPLVTDAVGADLDFSTTYALDTVAATFSGSAVNWGNSFAYFTYNLYPMYLVQQIFQANIALQEQPSDTAIAPTHGLFFFHQRAAIFGHNAPDWTVLPKPDGVSKEDAYGPNWNNYTLLYGASSSTTDIFLDQIYDGILPESWIGIKTATGDPIALRVHSMATPSLAKFTLNAKVSKLMLFELPLSVQMMKMRDTTVFCASEPLPLALVEDLSAVAGNTIILSDSYPELTPGQRVIISGQVPALGDAELHEVLEISAILTVDLRTKLVFKEAMAHQYRRDTVTLNANIIHATHGESHAIVLGNGQANQPFQSVALRHAPLTYLADATSTDGASSSLEVRVDRVQWHEVSSFFTRGPNERIFVTRQDESGLTHVLFGDGKTGRRPSTGLENITARYRSGLGLAGNVDADQIKLPLQKPHGVRGITNPLPAYGGAEPDQLVDIRQNATVGMRTLDRIVSLQDYEDFARSYNGIRKAHAAWSWAGEQLGIFVTVGGQTADAVPDATLRDLKKAIRRYGDPHVPLVIRSYTRRYFQVDALIFHHPDYLPQRLEEQIRAALRQAFGYDAARFGHHVASNDVIGLMHAVDGVVAVDLNALHFIEEAAVANPVLVAQLPQQGDSFASLTAATLLLLSPQPAQLSFAVSQEEER